MAKRKFIEKRRQNVAVERESLVEAREYRGALESLLSDMDVQFEKHWSEDNNDDYYGFKLWYDPPWDRTWYIVKNPFGGTDLELAIETSFDLMFGCACWSFNPTANSFNRYRETIKSIVEGRGATVKFCVGDATKACAVLIGNELDDSNDFALMERIAERDWYGTDRDIDYNVERNKIENVKKELRRFRSRCGWRAEFKYFNPKNDRHVEFNIRKP